MTGVHDRRMTSRVVRPQALEESLAADLRAARDRGAPLAHRRLSLEVRWGYRYDRYDRYDRYVRSRSDGVTVMTVMTVMSARGPIGNGMEWFAAESDGSRNGMESCALLCSDGISLSGGWTSQDVS